MSIISLIYWGWLWVLSFKFSMSSSWIDPKHYAVSFSVSCYSLYFKSLFTCVLLLWLSFEFHLRGEVFYPLTLSVFLDLVSLLQAAELWVLFCFIHSATLSVLIGACRPFTFVVIIINVSSHCHLLIVSLLFVYLAPSFCSLVIWWLSLVLRWIPFSFWVYIYYRSLLVCCCHVFVVYRNLYIHDSFKLQLN